MAGFFEPTVVGTGFTQRVDKLPDVPEFDPRSGEHCWTMAVLFRVDPVRWTDGSGRGLLDKENLITAQGPGCMFCEQIYTRRLAARRCTGEPPS